MKRRTISFIFKAKGQIMHRAMLKCVLSTALFAAVATGAARLASAAPVIGAVPAALVQAGPAHSQVENVRWVWRHHRRVWVRDFRHYRRAR